MASGEVWSSNDWSCNHKLKIVTSGWWWGSLMATRNVGTVRIDYWLKCSNVGF